MKALFAACLLCAGPAAAGDAWPPAPPALSFPRAPSRPPAGEELDPKVLKPGLDLLEAHDVNGLGADAAALSRWSRGREGLRLVERGGAWNVADASGASAPASPRFGAALRSMNRYFGLTAPTLAHPISHDELAAAFLSPRAIAAVAAVFDRSIAERVEAGGAVYLPELGGEATLDGELALHYNDDALRPTLKRLLARRDDPAALARLFDEEPANMARLDAQGLLKRRLAARADPRISVDAVVESAAAHYSGDFGTQLRTMVSDEWSGRYAGTWHCHPADVGPGGWLDDYPPSEADYEAAAKSGQELVITFLKDGFDVYDLSLTAGESPFRRPEPVSYRSADWRAHFDAALAALAPR